MKIIENLVDLMTYLGADTVQGMNRRIYKDTDCGASISVKTPDGQWHHNGQDWSGISVITAFTIQTIVEGSDVTVDSFPFELPVPVEDVDNWMAEMEQQATEYWNEANRRDEADDRK